MSSRKNSLVSFPAVSAGQMANNIVSAVTNIQRLDNVGYQGVYAGEPTGSFAVQVSADYAQDYLGNVTNAGTWIDVTLPSTPSAAGAAGNFYIDLNQLSAPWVRMKWTSTATVEQEITCVADDGGSLNDTYFFIQTANNGISYYVWFDVDSGGTDPMIPDMTGVEVDISEDDTAADVATAVAAALDALAGFVSSAVSEVVTVENAASGPCVPAYDSEDAPTGFQFEVTVGGGSLDLTFTGKML